MASKPSIRLGTIIDSFGLEVLYGPEGYREQEITTEDVNRSGMQLTGFFDYFDENRIQMIGLVETSYLEGLTSRERRHRFDQLLSYQVPALILARNLEPFPECLEMAEKYGADALRFNLITGNSPGNDMRFYVEKCEAMRNFCNKIWNASRFVMMNLTVEDNHLPEALETEDKWILSKLNRVVKEVCDNMDSFELGVAAGKIYDFIWDDYCDWYIELTKPRLNGDDEAAKESAQRVLLYVLVEILKLLHPFMPFITEEIWQALPHEGDALMMQSYPEYSEKLNFPEDEANFGMVMDAIKAVRARRSEMNVPPSRKSHLIIVTDKAKAFTDGEKFICKLAYASGVEVRAELPESTDGMVSVITDNARMFMPMAELVDLEKERARMEKELANAKKQLDGQNAKLANENFVSRAPEKVVNAEREKKAKLEALIENLEESLKNLG